MSFEKYEMSGKLTTALKSTFGRPVGDAYWLFVHVIQPNLIPLALLISLIHCSSKFLKIYFLAFVVCLFTPVQVEASSQRGGR